MDAWITKDNATKNAAFHAQRPEPDGLGKFASGYAISRWATFAMVPDAVWDSIGPGECKRVVVPEAFDPDGPIEVGDYVQTPRGTPAIVIVACSEFATCHDHDGDTYRVMRDELAILAKAPKPVPKPVPVVCRHCGHAAAFDGSPRGRSWVWCPSCRQAGPVRDTFAEAVEAWKKQNT